MSAWAILIYFCALTFLTPDTVMGCVAQTISVTSGLIVAINGKDVADGMNTSTSIREDEKEAPRSASGKDIILYNCSKPLPDAALSSDEYCAQIFADNLDQPRGLFVTPGNNILVIERGSGKILSLMDKNNDLVVDEIITVAQQNGLNHGLAVFGPHVYASSSSTVYRWTYSEGQETTSKEKEIVVKNINANGRGGAPFGHTTRTIVFDKQGRLYVSVGSAGNVDRDSFRSRIRRFTIFKNAQSSLGGNKFALVGELDFTKDGEVFADGVRNEVLYLCEIISDFK